MSNSFSSYFIEVNISQYFSIKLETSYNTDEFQGFGLMMTRYQPLSPPYIPPNGGERGVWLEEAELGLGLWEGEYQGIHRLWLRWFDRDQNWILTPAEAEKQRAEEEKRRADSVEAENQRLKQLLRENGISFTDS